MKRYARPFVITALLLLSAAAFFSQEPSTVIPRLTNKDVLKMVKEGLSSDAIIAKIKVSRCNFDTDAGVLSELEYRGVPKDVILAMTAAPYGMPKNWPLVTEPARIDPNASSKPRQSERAPTESDSVIAKKPSRRITDELTISFRRLQTSVVTVWSEFGNGTGFIVDRSGLVLTNQHVVGPSEYISVQFDSARKVPALLLASDADKDIAVLWVNLEAFPEATVAPIAKGEDGEEAVVEGERVFTIGSPMSQRKIMTTGIASKIEKKAIISDININPGNSGGPLFNSIGEVVGITTFNESRHNGPGISGIVRIEEAFSLLDASRREMKGRTVRAVKYLPVEPSAPYPLNVIKQIVSEEKFDTKGYSFEVGEFQVSLITPPLYYRILTEAEREGAKTKNKRNNKPESIQGTFQPFDELKNWAEYAGEYKAVLIIRATPNFGESFWGAVGRGLAANYGIHTPANLRFKTDFYRMKLMCGDNEVPPIQPGKIAHIINEKNYFIRAQDATYQGFYSYPASAISSACGRVTLTIFSEKNPNEPHTKKLDDKVISKVTTDFAPVLH